MLRWSGGHRAGRGLGFADPDLPELVYLEHATGALYIDNANDVSVYAAGMQRLGGDAEPPNRTADILRQVMHDLGGHGR